MLEARALLAADFGDAPAPYATLLADNGPRHLEAGPWLGTARDVEDDGAPSAAANGEGADDDGVTFLDLRAGNATASVTIVVSGAAGPAKLDAWLDLDADGSWSGGGEHILNSATVVGGENHFKFAIPATATIGTTFARFRLSTAGSLAPQGEAADGEVEDYQVTVGTANVGSGAFGSEHILPNNGSSINANTPASVIDFDRDGNFDLLATVNGRPGFFQNSGGVLAPRQFSYTANTPSSMAAGDVDRDGDLDVVYMAGTTVYLGKNAGAPTLTFTAIATNISGNVPISLADVDDDGDLDAIGGGISWFENNGSGVFTTRNISTSFSLGAVSSLSAIDLDGDGDLDFLVSASDKIGWFESTGVANRPLRTIATGSFGRAVSVDFDRDGDLDVVTSTIGQLRLFENDGTQMFASHALNSSSSPATFYVEVADIDADGDLDVLSTMSGRATLHRNTGSETLDRINLTNTAGENFSFVAAVDVDADGVLDVLAGNTGTNKRIMWLRQGAEADFGDAPSPYATTLAENGAHNPAIGPRLGPTRTAESDGTHAANASDDDGVAFGTMTIGAEGTAVVNVQNAPAGARVSAWIDFNHDGVWGGPGEQVVANQAVTEGDNLLEFVVPAGATPGTTWARVRITTAGSAGVNGGAPDGEIEDHAVTIATPALATNIFGPRQTISGSGDWLIPADLDQDGDLDVLSGNAWHENDGNGGLTQRTLVAVGSGVAVPYVIYHVADLDGDGDNDFLADVGDTLYWFENDGAQHFTPHDGGADSGGTQTNSFYFWDPPLAADIDGDGDVDSFGLSSNNVLSVFYNDGRQISAPATFTPLNGIPRIPRSVIAVDFDRDGDLDFVTLLNQFGIFGLMENKAGSFVYRDIAYTGVDGPADRFDTAVAGDVDGDGDVDLAVMGATSIHLLVNQGSGTFVAQAIDLVGRGTTNPNSDQPGVGLALADGDGDGDLDIFAMNHPTMTTSGFNMFENIGGLAFQKHVIATGLATQYVRSMFLGDMNGDGTLDVITSANSNLRGWYANYLLFDADYGDAPAPYPTLASEGGAAHSGTGPMLGPTRTADGGGAHSALADGDASDDGVAFGSLAVGQAVATFTVDVRNAPAGARVDAWIDFNGDGTWNQGEERVASSVPVVEGQTAVQFAIPSTAIPGQTFARVRINSTGGTGPKNAAVDGEVEDYAVTIAPPGNVGLDYSGFNAAWYLGLPNAGLIRSVDLDQDGLMDVVSLDRSTLPDGIIWRRNIGDGAYMSKTVNFGQAINLNLADDLRVADIDRDGDLDVAYAGVNLFGWFENNGSESFRWRAVTAPAGYSSTSKSLQIVDIEGDGDMDLMTARPGFTGGDVIVAFVNDGAQVFTARTLATTAIGLSAAMAADLDGDGDLDLAAAIDSAGASVQWFQNQDGTFVAKTAGAIRSPLVVAVDLDGDGDMDLVVGAGTGSPAGLNWLENDGHGAFTAHLVDAIMGLSFIYSSRDRVAAGDVDGDGDVDLAAGDIGMLRLYRNDGQQNFSQEPIAASPDHVFNSLSLADLNGDGDLEILAVDNSVRYGGWFEARERGDYNRDGYVDGADVMAWQISLGSSVPTPGTGADGDRDGAVGLGDLNVALANFGAAPYMLTPVANAYDPAAAESIVDGFDLLRWQQYLGDAATSPFAMQNDWDRNGVIDGGDLAIWQSQFGLGIEYDRDWIFSRPGVASTDGAGTANLTAAGGSTDEAAMAAVDAILSASDLSSLFETAKTASRSYRPGRRDFISR